MYMYRHINMQMYMYMCTVYMYMYLHFATTMHVHSKRNNSSKDYRARRNVQCTSRYIHVLKTVHVLFVHTRTCICRIPLRSKYIYTHVKKGNLYTTITNSLALNDLQISTTRCAHETMCGHVGICGAPFLTLETFLVV